MQCEAVLTELAAFLDAELSAAEAEAISVHLAGCAACADEREALARTLGRVRALPRVAAPPALAGAVAARIGAGASGKEPARSCDVVSCDVASCEDLSAYLDGELDAAASERVGSDIADCPACNETLVAIDVVAG